MGSARSREADLAPVQAPQPPLAVTPVVRTMPQRMARLKEEVHGIQESLDEQRALLDATGATYTRYSETDMPYQRRMVRHRTGDANTSTAPLDEDHPDP
ncbi:hypothetical protein Tco_0401518 [Tanacetum coccineum]